MTIQRILKIAKQSNNNIIIFDPENNEPYILLKLDEYEKMSQNHPLTEEKIIDKINYDTAFPEENQYLEAI